jgi:hypothetical protein
VYSRKRGGGRKGYIHSLFTNLDIGKEPGQKEIKKKTLFLVLRRNIRFVDFSPSLLFTAHRQHNIFRAIVHGIMNPICTMYNT